MSAKTGYKIALVGTQSLRGREIGRVLAESSLPIRSLELYDPDIEEEFSRLSQFRDEPKVVHRLNPESLEGLDLVFFAADPATNRTYAQLAGKLGFRAVDLSESFVGRRKVPLVVSGVNDHLLGSRPSLVSNPHPVTIILAHLFQPLQRQLGLAKAIAFVLQPASAFGQEGIDELAGQSVSLLSGAALPTQVFKQQSAFNLLSHTHPSDSDGFSAAERQIVSEIGRVLEQSRFPLSLSVIQASLFHTYAVMCYVELGREIDLKGMKTVLRQRPLLRDSAAEGFCSVNCISVTGRDEIFVGQVKKENLFPRSFWIWTVADNLTRGSALNALELAKVLLDGPAR
jgi:aspartate-semialdehyde dehydrogenase